MEKIRINHCGPWELVDKLGVNATLARSTMELWEARGNLTSSDLYSLLVPVLGQGKSESLMRFLDFTAYVRPASPAPAELASRIS